MSIDISSLIQLALSRDTGWAAKRVAEAYAYKEGRRYDGKEYVSMAAIWRDVGVVSYGAFRTRLHRGCSIKDSLGVE